MRRIVVKEYFPHGKEVFSHVPRWQRHRRCFSPVKRSNPPEEMMYSPWPGVCFPPFHLFDEEHLMIDGITSVGSSTTVSQIRMALFKKLDTNGDGMIDKTEIKAVLETGQKT